MGEAGDCNGDLISIHCWNQEHSFCCDPNIPAHVVTQLQN